MSAMSSKAAFSAAANRMRVNVQLVDAEKGRIISGPTGSISRSPTSLRCRTRLCRVWPTRSDTELVAAEARRAERWPDPYSMDRYFGEWLAAYSREPPFPDSVNSQRAAYFNGACPRN